MGTTATEKRHRDIGARIRLIRKDKKVRQVDLAANAGVSWRHLIRMEQGEGGEPKAETLDKLARALGVKRSDLTGDEDDEDSHAVSIEDLFDYLVLKAGEYKRAARA